MNRLEWLGSQLRPHLSFLDLAKRLSPHPTSPPHLRSLCRRLIGGIPVVGAQITNGEFERHDSCALSRCQMGRERQPDFLRR